MCSVTEWGGQPCTGRIRGEPLQQEQCRAGLLERRRNRAEVQRVRCSPGVAQVCSSHTLDTSVRQQKRAGKIVRRCGTFLWSGAFLHSQAGGVQMMSCKTLHPPKICHLILFLKQLITDDSQEVYVLQALRI